jgi:hypothetical protein
LGIMLLPREDVETMEDAIERRLETMASGGVRPIGPGPVRRQNPAGLFLVRPGQTLVPMIHKSPRKPKLVRGSRQAPPLKADVKRVPGRVIPMKIENLQVAHERPLRSMAGQRPLVWFCHAVLVWLKIV